MGKRDCVFCAIVASTAPASVVYEDDVALAFLDIHPVTSGHLLVTPKRHAASLADLEPAEGERLIAAGTRLAAALRASGLRCEGVNFFLADGEAAGQEVFHVHLHVIPRFAGDGFHLSIDRIPQPSRADLEATATRVRGAMPDSD
ncbi:MAG TPA: HIT family protein [Thermomicrobiales bacterium]|nr:HIT family protein [Thermomicrobiales bacterium]